MLEPFFGRGRGLAIRESPSGGEKATSVRRRTRSRREKAVSPAAEDLPGTKKSSCRRPKTFPARNTPPATGRSCFSSREAVPRRHIAAPDSKNAASSSKLRFFSPGSPPAAGKCRAGGEKALPPTPHSGYGSEKASRESRRTVPGRKSRFPSGATPSRTENDLWPLRRTFFPPERALQPLTDGPCAKNPVPPAGTRVFTHLDRNFVPPLPMHATFDSARIIEPATRIPARISVFQRNSAEVRESRLRASIWNYAPAT
jgi:hypothetical protein